MLIMLQWLCCKYMFQIFHLFQTYVATVLSGCCKSRSGEEAQGRVVPVWKRRGSHPSGMEEVGAKRCGRDGRGAGVEETGLSHPGGVCSGAEGSGPNTSGAQIRETRPEQARASGCVQPSGR